jgi:hypothetical protein
MKKLLFLSLALVALMSASLIAGDYHTQGELVCNECHVMHYSQSHTYGANVYQAELGGGPNTFLLRNKVNELCLSCHDGEASVPDVLDDNTGAAVRNAGALNKIGGTYPQNSGHTLGYTGATYPGKGAATFVPDATEGLECTNCHNPHGVRGGYRNLSTTVTYGVNATTPDLTKDVWEKNAAHQFAGGTNHYDISNIEYCEPGGTGSKYADMCKKCHDDFHGAIGGTQVGGTLAAGSFIRHPASDVNIGALGGGHSAMFRAASGTTPIDRGFAAKSYRVKVLSSLGNWGTQGTTLRTTFGATLPADLTPSCMSCHKSHGNENPFGLVYATGNAPITENGDGAYQDLCKQCHIQGWVF